MRNLYKIISFVLTISLVASCPQFFEQCSCKGGNLDEKMKISCPAYEIAYKSETFVKVTCKNESIAHFNYNISTLTENAIILAFKECNFAENFNTTVFSSLIGVQNFKILVFNNENNNYINLSKNNFSPFPNVEVLVLKKFEIIDQDVLENMPNLKYLNIVENRILNISKRFFKNLIHISQIILSDNLNISFQSKIFNFPNDITLLSINNNNLITLPKDIFLGLTKLRILELNENNFEILPRGLLKNALELEEFELQNNRETLVVPNYFCSNLKFLKYVTLANSKIRSLPENTFWGSNNLKTIDIRKNLLTTLPPNIFNNLRNLEVLRLRNNLFHTLSNNYYSTNTKLVFVDINSNYSRAIFSSLLESSMDMEKSLENIV